MGEVTPAGVLQLECSVIVLILQCAQKPVWVKNITSEVWSDNFSTISAGVPISEPQRPEGKHINKMWRVNSGKSDPPEE